MQRDEERRYPRSRSRTRKQSKGAFPTLLVVIIFAVLFFALLAWNSSSQEAAYNYDGAGSTQPRPTYRYVGSKNSNIYHKPSCEWAKEIKSYNAIWFTSTTNAISRGYRACKVCKP
jgi:hypothetical protein